MRYNSLAIKPLQGRVKFPTGGILREPSGRTGATPVATVKVWMKEELFLCTFFTMEKFQEVGLKATFFVIGGALMKKLSTKKMAILALFSALAVVLTLLMRIPLIPSIPFFTYDPKDIVIGIAGFLFGPASAFVVSAISSGIELAFRGGNIIDWAMNVLSSCAFICTAAFVYKKMHSKNGAFYGLLTGIVVQNIVMLAWNYVMDPIYFGMDQQAVIAMLPMLALFNFLKCSINTILLLLVYKPIANALRLSGLVAPSEQTVPSNSKVIAIVGCGILLTIVVVTLTMLKG